MKEFFDNLKEMIEEYGSSPTLEEMQRRTLKDKGIDGPTAAHVIEEVHCPLNLAYLTFTTGSSAFQNIVGVTHSEMKNRIKASKEALKQAGVRPGDKLLFTYPPLVNVFSNAALTEYGVRSCFLPRSSRDAFLSVLYQENPDVIIGESTFLRVALEDAKKIGIVSDLPKKKIIITAGTPLDLDLLPIAEEVLDSKVHDLYGCQEFGWLVLDGLPLRKDITLIKSNVINGENITLSRSNVKKSEHYEFVVGGLPMGDSFVVSEAGHICNRKGKIITYRRERTNPEYEVIVKATTLSSPVTVDRAARTILRIKGRVVKVDPDIKTLAPHTILELVPSIYNKRGRVNNIRIEGPEKTALFDDMVQAQVDYGQSSKSDPTWIKTR